MLLITDITGIWCFLLVTQNDGDRNKMMDTKSSKFVDFMIFILISIFIASFFLPSHYGVKCSKQSAPMGPLFLCLFYMFWTCFTVKVIKNDPLIALKDESNKSIYEKTKQLSLHEYEGEFDHDKMLLAQR